MVTPLIRSLSLDFDGHGLGTLRYAELNALAARHSGMRPYLDPDDGSYTASCRMGRLTLLYWPAAAMKNKFRVRETHFYASYEKFKPWRRIMNEYA